MLMMLVKSAIIKWEESRLENEENVTRRVHLQENPHEPSEDSNYDNVGKQVGE